MEWNGKCIIHVQTHETLEKFGSRASVAGLRKLAPAESSIDVSMIQRSHRELSTAVLRQDLVARLMSKDFL
jgi:hypothetical protein